MAVEYQEKEKIHRPIDTSLERALPFSKDDKLRRRFKILDKDIPGNIRWGRILEELDKMAEDVALKYVWPFEPEGRVVTAAVDDIALHVPGDINQDAYLRARINYVGRTSMEVGIRVDQDKEAKHSLAACYFTMVARKGHGDGAESLPIPPLKYESDLEKERCERATGSSFDQQSLITSVEGTWQVFKPIEFSAKGAMRVGKIRSRASAEDNSWFESRTQFLALQLRYHVWKKWDTLGESRWRRNIEARDSRQGFLVSISRKITDFLRFGAGYNFTDFSDDLSDLDYNDRGWFINIVGTY